MELCSEIFCFDWSYKARVIINFINKSQWKSNIHTHTLTFIYSYLIENSIIENGASHLKELEWNNLASNMIELYCILSLYSSGYIVYVYYVYNRAYEIVYCFYLLNFNNLGQTHWDFSNFNFVENLFTVLSSFLPCIYSVQ